jgi:hypothetical protein
MRISGANASSMANCIKTLGAYYGRPTWFEKVFPSRRPWSVRTVAPPKLTLGTDLKTKFVTMTVLTIPNQNLEILEKKVNMIF